MTMLNIGKIAMFTSVKQLGEQGIVKAFLMGLCLWLNRWVANDGLEAYAEIRLFWRHDEENNETSKFKGIDELQY